MRKYVQNEDMKYINKIDDWQGGIIYNTYIGLIEMIGASKYPRVLGEIYLEINVID